MTADGASIFLLNSSLTSHASKEMWNVLRLVRFLSLYYYNSLATQLRGGQVVEDQEEADIIILPQEPDILKAGRDEYRGNPDTRVEDYRWLIESVKRQYVKFTPPEIKTMPGNPELVLQLFYDFYRVLICL